MSQIKPVTMYPCPVSGKLFKTAKGAANNAAKELAAQTEAKKSEEAAKALVEQKKKSDQQLKADMNSVRLNCTDVKDLPKMIIEAADKFLNIEVTDLVINVSFGDISNSHGCPLNGVTNWSGRDENKPKYYKGWGGQIKAKAKARFPIDRHKSSTSINDYLFRYGSLVGFHTGTGCPGTINESTMDIGFYFFLDDFPLLKEKYEKFLIEKEKFIKNKETSRTYEMATEDYADVQPDVTKIDGEIAELNKQIAALSKTKQELLVKHNQEYKVKNPLNLVPMSEDWDKLKSGFTSGWGERWLNDDYEA